MAVRIEISQQLPVCRSVVNRYNSRYAIRARDIVNIATDLQTVIYYTTIYCDCCVRLHFVTPTHLPSLGQRFEAVENFQYLGAIIFNEGSKPEILSRVTQTTIALFRLKIIWRDKNISLASKVKLMRTLILSTFFYACESWTLTAELERRIQALEKRCCRRLLNISYKDHVTNEEVRNNSKMQLECMMIS